MSQKPAPRSKVSDEPLRAFDPDGPRRISLDGKELEEVLALFVDDRHDQSVTRARRSARVMMNGKTAAARVFHPGGGATHWEVCMLDISEGGAGLIYPGFLHVGTRLAVTIRKPREGDVTLPGKVMWCRFLRKQYHAVGVSWDRAIEAREFVDSAAWIESRASDDSKHTGALKGKVIHLCSRSVEHQLLCMQLSNTEIKIEHAKVTGSLLDLIRRASADLLILDADAMGGDPVGFLRTLRSEQFIGPILVTTPASMLEIESLRIDADIESIGKPITQETLQPAIRMLLNHRSDKASGTAPILSTLANDADKKKWISDFIEQSRALGSELISAITADETPRALEICQTFAVTGTGYGFPLVSEVAARAVKSLYATASAHESGPDLRTLKFVLDRLRVSLNDAA